MSEPGSVGGDTGRDVRDVVLDGAVFRNVSLRDARLRGVDVSGSRWSGAELVDVDISGEVQGLRVNGVDVGPLVEAELDRRHPERALMRPADADGFRHAWAVLGRLWEGTVERARALPSSALDERVGGKWSFVQRLRHLVFATDSWVGRAILGDPRPWHPLGLPWEEMGDHGWIVLDRDARPTLDEVLAVRADRVSMVGRYLDALTDEQLAQLTEPVVAPGWPASRAYPVRQCLRIVLNEEWEHRLYAERDLALLR